ncbi:KPN_02809 family neutral zinc metallopeptidase [Mycetocola reblochoni]|uniref:YpfJ protein, zinc metalloprotease superfamily n=2 Tax=Mycetocola reblochoni TaxID=331618 RepID=A0A1R4JNA3_9MICO|nr:neutral zinc metallopeptidase [Mycetocola reblochoni]RLP68607.1 neutral zinc metallopeptidase [Mycetocola reblochoni]SJN33506.1 YpfJ protein, zinc metalloprotease superfamily [Mycetocola reblochoni REB411]
MTFTPDADISSSKVRRRRSGARTGGIAAGGGVLGVIVLVLVGQAFGIDLSALLGASSGLGSSIEGRTGTISEQDLGSECRTGQDANDSADCRMSAAYVSLDDFWSRAYAEVGDGAYHSPDFLLFSDGTSTACGYASSAVGPFYCPGDEAIYIDTAFFGQLSSQLGAEGGPLAELYIAAHEWGHHIQHLAGTFDRADRSGTGPSSDSVRLELQADCFAGAWVGGAAQTSDASGGALLEPPSRAQIASALDAAAAVGDDHIQQASGGIDQDSWTHGSSQQRQSWFTAGLEGGVIACDTFAVASP